MQKPSAGNEKQLKLHYKVIDQCVSSFVVMLSRDRVHAGNTIMHVKLHHYSVYCLNGSY